MTKSLNKWYRFLAEQEKKFVRLPGHTCDIHFKTGLVKDLVKEDKNIKKLRVPGWSLQTSVYVDTGEYDYASVAYCGKEPVAIVALTDDHARYISRYDHKQAILNFFVDSWHRGMGLADKLFLNVMEQSSNREFIVASRGGRHMLEKHGYQTVDMYCNYLDCNVYTNKNYVPVEKPEEDAPKKTNPSVSLGKIKNANGTLNESQTAEGISAIMSLLGGGTMYAAEDKLRKAFRAAGATDIEAIQYVENVKYVIVEAIPRTIEVTAENSPAVTSRVAGMLFAMVPRAGSLIPILRTFGRANIYIQIVFAMKDTYDILSSWEEFAKTSGQSNVAAIDKLRRLRELEQQIKEKGFEEVKRTEANTALKRYDIIRYFYEAKKMYPNVINQFPDVFNLLDPGSKKDLM